MISFALVNDAVDTLTSLPFGPALALIGEYTILESVYFMPQRRGSLEPTPRGPFGLSALFHYVIVGFFWFSPKGPVPLIVWWVVGGR